MNDRRSGFWSYASVVLWICVIFVLSSPNGSSAETSRIIRPLIEFFFPNASPDVFDTVHFLVRKTAHFTEYAILAGLAFRAARNSGSSLLKRHYAIAAVVLVAAVACLDEFNQSFEPSRTSSVWDSALDVFGGIVAVAVCWLWFRRRR